MNKIINTNIKIDSNNYLISLLLYLRKNNIIAENKYQQKLLEILNLLEIKIKKYTKEVISSIPIYLAKNINNSNIWTINYYFKNKPLQEKINALINQNIIDLYYLSREYLFQKVNKVKLFYNVIFLNNLLEVNNTFYNDTLKLGIKSFFKIYNPEYDAENYLITVDYNPYLERPNLKGIEFIEEYLNYLNHENIFCRNFPLNKIDNLLKEIYDNYQDIPINIFETIFLVSILLMYQNKNIFDLDIREININNLYLSYTRDPKEYSKNLRKSYITLKNKLKLDNKTINYIDKSFDLLLQVIIYATKNHYLEITLNINRNNNIKYLPNISVENKLFRENLNNSDDIFSGNQFSSMLDNIDFLDNSLLSENKLINLLENLNIIDLMTLKKWYTVNYNENVISLINKTIQAKNLNEQKIINDYFKLINIESLY